MGKIEILTFSDAWQMASSIYQSFQREGKKANIAIVNVFGHQLLTAAMDGTRPITLRFAIQKALEAAATGQSTRWLSEKAISGEISLEVFGLDAKSHVPWAGGSPVYLKDGTQIGAVGVSGMAEDDDEKACVRAISEAGYLFSRP